MGITDALLLTIKIPEDKTDQTVSFCSQGFWKSIQDAFTANVYVPIVIFFFLIGVFFNLLNAAIFAKNKISPTIILFIGLAITDAAGSILGIPFSWYYLMPSSGAYSKTSSSSIGPYSLSLLRLFYNVSVLHTTTLSVWRFVAETFPTKERTWCSVKNTYIIIGASYAFCIFYEVAKAQCTSNMADGSLNMLKNDGAPSLRMNQTTADGNATITANENFLCTFPDQIYNVIVNILPSLLVTISSIRSIFVSRSSKKSPKEQLPNPQTDLVDDAEKSNQKKNSARMFFGVIILFLLDKIGAAISWILNALSNIDFILDCFPAVVQLFSIFSLIYVTIPFVIYFLSNPLFRAGLKALILPKKCYKQSDDVGVQMNTR